VKELTTLQVARRCADAALAAAPADAALPDHEHPPTRALIEALHQSGSWFCRLDEDRPDEAPMVEPGPAQLGLF
jgi:hypothetical protein